MLSVDDLITALTPDQVKASLYKIADTFGLNTTAWQKLSPTRVIFAIVAQLFSGFTILLAALARAGFLDKAKGAWLTLLAFFVYGVTRNPATFAVGVVTIDNTGGGLYHFAAGDLVVLNSTSGKTYTNTLDITINPLETGVAVDVHAVELGSASTSAPATIDSFAAASPSLSVTNAESVIGDDEEDDDALKDRCRLSLGALSPNGAAAAMKYVALTPSLNGGVAITRCVVLPALGNGTIRVVVASESGPVSGTTGDPTSDLGKVFKGLNTWAVTSGYTLVLTSATAHVVTLAINVWLDASTGLSSDDVRQAIATKLTSYFGAQPIGGVVTSGGGKVSWRAIVGQIEASIDDGLILEATLGSETDVSLGTSEVPTFGTPTYNVHFVA